MGLDDIDFAEFTLPPLTTIRLRARIWRAPPLRPCASRWRPAIRRFEREFLVSTSLVVRGSTAAPAKAEVIVNRLQREVGLFSLDQDAMNRLSSGGCGWLLP